MIFSSSNPKVRKCCTHTQLLGIRTPEALTHQHWFGFNTRPKSTGESDSKQITHKQAKIEKKKDGKNERTKHYKLIR